MLYFRPYYRVPTGSSNPAQGTWGDFNVSNFPWQGINAIAGRRFTTQQSWDPACGLRYYDDGTLNGITSGGHSWSASPYVVISAQCLVDNANFPAPTETPQCGPCAVSKNREAP